MDAQQSEKAKQRSMFRQFAYQGDSESFRKGALQIQNSDPSREVTVDLLELNAYLIECDFLAVEGKIQAINAKYAKDNRQFFVSKFSQMSLAHNQFAKGQISGAIEISYSYIDENAKISDLDPVDILGIYRLLAQSLWVSGRYLEIDEIESRAKEFNLEKDSVHATYVMNCIIAINLCAKGEILKSLEVAERNLTISNQNSFSGIYGPIDMKLVIVECYSQLHQFTRAEKYLRSAIDWSNSASHYSWLTFSMTLEIRQNVMSKKFKEALITLRKIRENFIQLNYKNQLGNLADEAEFSLRMNLGDFDRAEVLLSRLDKSDLWAFHQLRLACAQGQDTTELLSLFPENSPREILEKRFLSAVQYKDKRSLCLEYLQESLGISEETGMRAIFYSNEELARRIIEGINLDHTQFFEVLASDLTDFISAETVLQSGLVYEPLSKRELQVLRCMATGDKIQTIALNLHLSINTLKTHSKNIYRKLGASGRVDAVRIARENQLI
jgi:LuxR family transcriptional regulator, maltose regulon positive regulatory protein